MKRILSFFLLSFAFITAVAQIPNGYYNQAAGLAGAPLKTALKNIIENGHQDHGYDGLWNAYNTTDRDYFYENDGTVLDIYSEDHLVLKNVETTPVKETAITVSTLFHRAYLVLLRPWLQMFTSFVPQTEK